MATNSLENKVVLGLHLDAGASDGYLVSAVNVKDETGNQTVQDALDAIDGKIGDIDFTPYVKKTDLASKTTTAGASLVGVAKTTSGNVTLASDTLDNVLTEIAGKLDTANTNISAVSDKATQNASDISTINTTLATKANASQTVTAVTLSTKTLSVTTGGTTKTYTTQDTIDAIVVGTSTSTANAAVTTNGSVSLNHIENGTKKSSHLIKGSGLVSVTSDASGNITIGATAPTYDLATADADGLMSSEDFTKLAGIAEGAQKNDVGWTSLEATYTTDDSLYDSGVVAASKVGATLIFAGDGAIKVEVDSKTPDKVSIMANTASDTEIEALFT